MIERAWWALVAVLDWWGRRPWRRRPWHEL